MRSQFLVLLSAAFLCTLAIGCSGGGADAEAVKESKKPGVKAKGAPAGNATPDVGAAPPIVRP
jgi:hypothetical protein